MLLLCRQAGCENGVNRKSNVPGEFLTSSIRVRASALADADPPAPPGSPGVGSLLSLLPSLRGQVVELAAATRSRLEELLLEGDLLEVSLDQTFLIHRVLQAASAPPTERLHALIQVRGLVSRSRSSGPPALSRVLSLSLSQTELEEQRRSSRGRSKDKRKRRSHRGECGEKGGQRSPEGSDSKKTCPTSHSHSSHLAATLHPEVSCSPAGC